MNMRDLCLMNADKTDNSNTNRTRNQTSGTILPGKTEEVQLESQSAGDLQAEKQRSAGRQKIGDITKSLSDGSTNNPTGNRKSQQATTATKTNLLGDGRNPKISARKQELTAQARTATKATP